MWKCPCALYKIVKGVESLLHSFLTSAIEVVSRQLHAPDASPQDNGASALAEQKRSDPVPGLDAFQKWFPAPASNRTTIPWKPSHYNVHNLNIGLWIDWNRRLVCRMVELWCLIERPETCEMHNVENKGIQCTGIEAYPKPFTTFHIHRYR